MDKENCYNNRIGIKNGYMQDLEDNEKKYVPKWNT